MKPFKEWTVLPHGKLSVLDANLLSVTGEMNMPPMGKVERRMSIVRLQDRRLIIFSAIALDEAEMQAIDEYGVPTFLIVPSDIHRMDAKIWKDRYPALRVITPASAATKVGEVVTVDATSVDFNDPSVRFISVPGTDAREAALLVETESGTTLILNDLVFDLANRPGFSGWLFKVIGMTGDEPHIPPVIKMRTVKDERALRKQLESWAHLPHLERVIISHGAIISDHPERVLERIANELAA